MPNRCLPSRIAIPGVPVAHIAAFAVALFAGKAVHHKARLQENTARQFIQAQGFVDLPDPLEVSLVYAQTGQRGYLLTGQQAYLEPYRLCCANQARQRIA